MEEAFLWYEGVSGCETLFEIWADLGHSWKAIFASEELKEQFSTIDKDESGFIELGELKEALDLAGFKVPGWRVRDMIDK